MKNQYSDPLITVLANITIGIIVISAIITIVNACFEYTTGKSFFDNMASINNVERTYVQNDLPNSDITKEQINPTSTVVTNEMVKNVANEFLVGLFGTGYRKVASKNNEYRTVSELTDGTFSINPMIYSGENFVNRIGDEIVGAQAEIECRYESSEDIIISEAPEITQEKGTLYVTFRSGNDLLFFREYLNIGEDIKLNTEYSIPVQVEVTKLDETTYKISAFSVIG